MRLAWTRGHFESCKIWKSHLNMERRQEVRSWTGNKNHEVTKTAVSTIFIKDDCMMPSFSSYSSSGIHAGKGTDTHTERGRNFRWTKNLSLSLFLSSQHWYVSGCCKLCWLVDVNSCWVREYSRYSVSLDTSRLYSSSRCRITSFKPCKPHPFLLHGPSRLVYFITLSEQSYSKLNDLLNNSVKSLLFGILRRLSQHILLGWRVQTSAAVWITLTWLKVSTLGIGI